MKIHVTENGHRVCKAEEGKCPLGGEHYDGLKAAYEAYQTKLNNSNDSMVSLSKKKQHLMKSLMDDFSDAATECARMDDWSGEQFFILAESAVNNCHGKNNNEIFNYLDNVLDKSNPNFNKIDEILNKYK